MVNSLFPTYRFLRFTFRCSALLTLCFVVTATAQRITRISPTNINMRGICLADYSHSMAVGDSAYIYISRDTGMLRSWYPLQPPCSRSHTLYGVSYYDTLHAAMVGDAGLIFTTSDAGSSWQQTASGMTSQTLRGIVHTVDGGLTVVGDSGIILRSMDGGSTWSNIASSRTYNINSIAINATGFGVIVGEHSFIGTTTDFGATWPTFTDTMTDGLAKNSFFTFRSVAVSEVDSACAVGDSGAIVRTVNGNRWFWSGFRNGKFTGADSAKFYRWFSVVNRSSLRTVAYTGLPPNRLWYIAGDANLQINYGETNHFGMSTASFRGDADGGTDTAAAVLNCQAVWRGNPHQVIQSGGPSKALGTVNDTNSSASGFIQPEMLGFGNFLFSSIGKDGYGFATGVGGSFGRTTDNGFTWRDKAANVFDLSYYATEIYTFDSNNAFAAGWSGNIYRTTDGGVHWVSTNIDPNMERMHSIAHPADEVFVMCGDFGTILRSVDNAVTWTPSNTTTPEYLESVAFSTQEIGVAVGTNGEILRTVDQGVTWSDVNNSNSGTTTSYRQLAAFPSGMYYATTDNSGLFRSADQGLSWGAVPNAPSTMGMCFYNEKIGVIAESAWSSRIVADTMRFAFTRDGFATKPIQFNIPIYSNHRMAFHFLDSNTFLCFGSGGFVVKVEMSPTDGVQATVMSRGSDFQVYPNPSSGELHISYATKSVGVVTIELWNAAAKKIETMSNGVEQARDHSRSFTLPKDLHGAYFVRLTRDGGTSEQGIVME